LLVCFDRTASPPQRSVTEFVTRRGFSERIAACIFRNTAHEG
jgi:hypothetical protein